MKTVNSELAGYLDSEEASTRDEALVAANLVRNRPVRDDYDGRVLALQGHPEFNAE